MTATRVQRTTSQTRTKMEEMEQTKPVLQVELQEEDPITRATNKTGSEDDEEAEGEVVATTEEVMEDAEGTEEDIEEATVGAIERQVPTKQPNGRSQK